MVRFVVVFFLFFVLNVLVRTPYLFQFGLLNEDASLFRGAIQEIIENGWSHWFYNPLGGEVAGTGMIRPFQVMGFGVQGFLFGNNEFLPHLWSLFFLTLAQSIFYFSLAYRFSRFAFIGALLPSLARAGAEPTNWLADQHDLYLYLGISIVLLVSELMERRNVGPIGYLFQILGFWLCFLCNEKAVVVPLLFVLWSVVKLNGSDRTYALKRKVLPVLFTASFGILSYLAFRFYVLGVVIGGYDDRAVSLGGITVEHISDVTLTLITLPFFQSTAFSFYIAAPIGVLLLLSLCYASRIKAYYLLMFILGLLIASLPTYRFFPSFPHLAVSETRMYWLPLIVWSLGLSSLLSNFATYGKNSRRLSLIAAVVLLSLSMLGGRSAAKQVASASTFTDEVLSSYIESCSCADTTSPKVNTLPLHFDSVNVFTEVGWLEGLAAWKGMRECTGEDRSYGEVCSLEYRVRGERMKVVPFKTSKSFLEEYEFNLGELQSDNTRFEIKQTTKGRRDYFRGVEVVSSEGDRVILYLGDKPRSAATLINRNGSRIFNLGVRGRDEESVALVLVKKNKRENAPIIIYRDE